MSNVFRYTGVNYFQFPEAVVDDKIALLSHHGLKLYLLILRRAQQASNPVVKISTKEAILILDLKENNHGRARDELLRHGLAKSGPVNRQGQWWYHLLNPMTGDPLEDPRALVDLNKLSPDQVKRYFMHHLAPYDAVETEKGLSSRCPFHTTSKMRQTPFSVKLIDGGVWNCFKCQKSGRPMEFEKEIALAQGEAITSSQAFDRLRWIVKQVPGRSEQTDDEGMPIEP